MNPSVDKEGLALNIDMDNNMPDIVLAKSVGSYFRLGTGEMNNILEEVMLSVSGWQNIATQIGIPRSEQALMSGAFKV